MVANVRTELSQAGQRLPDGVRDRIMALGGSAVPDLTAILGDDELLSATGPGQGWAPIHAVDLLGALRAAEAIEPMLRVLADTDFMDIVHDRIVQRMPELGAPVVEPALRAYADSTDEDYRCSLAAILAKAGVPDERIFTMLVERLEADAAEAANLAEYGDRRALPHLARALDRCPVAHDAGAFANQDLIELHAAIEDLGGALTAEQVSTMRAVDVEAEAAQAALRRAVVPRRATAAQTTTRAPKRGRNQRCWCGSGRKYKLCHLRADEDALAG